MRTSDEMWHLSRRVRSSPELIDLFSLPTATIVTRLRSSDHGSVIAEFADAFQQFLDEYGWRSDAVFDVADATWREDPSIPIDSVRGYVRLSDEHDPAVAFEASVSRETLTQAAREARHDPESLATFDRYHEAARHNLRSRKTMRSGSIRAASPTSSFPAATRRTARCRRLYRPGR